VTSSCVSLPLFTCDTESQVLICLQIWPNYSIGKNEAKQFLKRTEFKFVLDYINSSEIYIASIIGSTKGQKVGKIFRKCDVHFDSNNATFRFYMIFEETMLKNYLAGQTKEPQRAKFGPQVVLYPPGA